MHDEAGIDRSKDSGIEFEPTAIAIDGTQKGTYYGSTEARNSRLVSGTTSFARVVGLQGTCQIYPSKTGST
jgi:hypothetical protein